jgi:4-aminobutyrate aminotransferase-like enzyme
MTGFGRTGRMFGFEHDAVTPDLVCVGKGLGGGMPISACLGREEVMSAWAQSSDGALHTGTFFGHPVCAAAALATLDVLEQEALTQRAATLGQQLQAALADRGVAAVRGRGLLVGIELDAPGRALRCMQALLERGYITVPAGADARVISLTPPLCVTEEQLNGFVAALVEVLAVSS